MSFQVLKTPKKSVPKNYKVEPVITAYHLSAEILANISGNRTKGTAYIESDVFKKYLKAITGFKHYDLIRSLLSEQDVHQMETRKTRDNTLEFDLDHYEEDLDLDIPPYSTQIIKVTITPLEEDDEEDLWN